MVFLFPSLEINMKIEPCCIVSTKLITFHKFPKLITPLVYQFKINGNCAKSQGTFGKQLC